MPQSVLCDASSGVAPEALVAGNQALSSIAPGAAMAGGAAEFQAAARLLKISGANESGGSQTGSQHTPPSGGPRPRPGTVMAGQVPTGRRPATFSDCNDPSYKRGGAG